MKKIIVLFLTLLTVNANAAVLCESPNGGVPYNAGSLANAAVSPSCKNTAVRVTTALTSAFSNISSATVHEWPADRALRVEKGGAINPTTTFTGLPYAEPEWFGATGNGVANDYAALNKAALSLSAGGRLELPAGKSYLHNSAATITFPNKVVITGEGTITVGATVGQRPAFIIAGNNSRLEKFSIVGDSTNFTNADESTELRRLIKVTGDDVHIKNINMSEGIYGIEFSATSGGSVTKSKFYHSTINHDTIATFPNQNNCQAIYATGDSIGLEVSDNYAFGYGQFLFSGQRNRAFRITNNRMDKQGDNGLYLSLIGSTVTGNVGENIRQSTIKGFFSKTNISHNEAYTTDSYTSYAGIFVQALNNYVGQEIDAEGNNSYGIIVQGNVVDGSFSSAGIIGEENPVDASGYESVLVDSNTIRGRATTATATSGMVGVQLVLSTAARKSWGSAITNNLISQVYRGISAQAPSTGFYRFARISGNRIHHTVENGMSLNYVDRGDVSNNIVFDAIGTAVTPNVFSLTGVTNTLFTNNNTGNSSAAGKFSNHFLENSACSGNEYIDNRSEQTAVTGSLLYTINDATARIHIPNVVRTRSIVGDSGFYVGEGHLFLITPSGNGFKYTPVGQFPAGFELTIINNAAGAYNLIFDSLGLNATIAQGAKGSYVYTGTAWK